MLKSEMEPDSRGKLKPMLFCEVCSSKFQQGANVYEGHKLKGYNLFVCGICKNANWDGWQSHRNGLLIARCRELGIEPPSFNEKGCLPFEF